MWNRKNKKDEFDITIGASDSPEVTDLVGIYLLHKLGVGLGEGDYIEMTLYLR